MKAGVHTYRNKDFPLYNASTSILDGITVGLAVFSLTRDYRPAWWAGMHCSAALPLLR
ncbi:MAG: hypothetical protein R3E68_15325 [Burkholderiaceae bacterium]